MSTCKSNQKCDRVQSDNVPSIIGFRTSPIYGLGAHRAHPSAVEGFEALLTAIEHDGMVTRRELKPSVSGSEGTFAVFIGNGADEVIPSGEAEAIGVAVQELLEQNFHEYGQQPLVAGFYVSILNPTQATVTATLSASHAGEEAVQITSQIEACGDRRTEGLVLLVSEESSRGKHLTTVRPLSPGERRTQDGGFLARTDASLAITGLPTDVIVKAQAITAFNSQYLLEALGLLGAR